MIETTPEVYLIAEPRVRTDEMLAFLRAEGGEEWFERVGSRIALDQIPHAEGLIEFMGRLCYKSWVPGLNKNVTKIREDRGEYLLNILRQAHGSVLEHAHFTFALRNVSRVFTAEMNRHRLTDQTDALDAPLNTSSVLDGINVSEQSLRYVRLDELGFRLPTVLKSETQEIMREVVEFVEQRMSEMLTSEEMDDPALDFHHKKIVTSALRRAIPMGISTHEGWTGNVRAIRHVIEQRSAEGAEEELRIVADQMARKMQTACPVLFGDYQLSTEEPPAWGTKHAKV